jgi:pimeloyl-ACP methyl ester carboxylesterase
MRPVLTSVFVFICSLLHAADPATRVVPGETLTLNFPELGEMHDKLPAACQVSIPKHFDPAKPVPLLVWFGGGKGSHSVGGARGVVDFDRFVVVALPYPGGVLPRIAAQKDGRIDAHWAFQKPMLEGVARVVPNLDPRLRLVAGTSSGGHHIAYGLDRGWAGFADYFTAFIVHEGGAQPLTPRLPGAKRKRLLVVYGEESDSLTWRTWFNWHVERSGADATIIGVPGAGHGLNEDGRKVIREWIEGLKP